MEALPYHLYMFDLHSLLVLHRADVLETFPHLAALLAKLEQLDVSPIMGLLTFSRLQHVHPPCISTRNPILVTTTYPIESCSGTFPFRLLVQRCLSWSQRARWADSFTSTVTLQPYWSQWARWIDPWRAIFMRPSHPPSDATSPPTPIPLCRLTTSRIVPRRLRPNLPRRAGRNMDCSVYPSRVLFHGA